MSEQYDAIGHRYQDIKSLPLARYVEQPTVLGMMSGVRGRRVLDLACGTGFYARHASRLGASEVVGVDISPEMVRTARRIEEERGDGITYLVADAAEFSGFGRFDLVLAIYLFNYADSESALRAMVSAVLANTASGGRLHALMARPGYDFDGPGLAKYGFTFHRKGQVTGGIRLGVTAHTDPAISFTAHVLDRSVIDQVLTEAGIEEHTWTPVEVSADTVAEFGADYWHDFRVNPPWISLLARTSRMPACTS